MVIFFKGDRVIDNHGKCGTVVGDWGEHHVSIKWDDGMSTITNIFYLTRLKEVKK